MNIFLRDKTKKEQKLLAIDTYQKNLELYHGKSLSWVVRITADEIGMKKNDLVDIIEKWANTKHGED